MRQQLSLRDRQGRRKYLNAQERERFLEASQSLPLTKRLFCETLCFTGCRISEALQITQSCIDPDESIIVFKTLKRRRFEQRYIKVPKEYCLALKQLRAGPFSFCRTTAYLTVKKVMEQANIVGIQASPKGLRHGFGVACVIKNVSISRIAKWMGHGDIRTSLIYLDISGDEDLALMQRTWPQITRNLKYNHEA